MTRPSLSQAYLECDLLQRQLTASIAVGQRSAIRQSLLTESNAKEDACISARHCAEGAIAVSWNPQAIAKAEAEIKATWPADRNPDERLCARGEGPPATHISKKKIGFKLRNLVAWLDGCTFDQRSTEAD